MSKIIKFNNLNLDTENFVNIEVPNFENELQLFEEDAERDDFQDTSAEYFNDTELEEEDVLEVAKAEAEQIIEEARLEAERIIEEAQNSASIQKQEILQSASQEGYKEGYKKAVEDADDITKESVRIREDAVRERKETLDSIEAEVVELVVDIVDKILFGAVMVNPKVITTLIRRNLESTNISGDVFVHVSESDYEKVLENKTSIVVFNEKSTNIEIIKDFSLKSGDCLIETSFGNIDCSIGQQFQSLKENLYFILENS